MPTLSKPELHIQSTAGSTHLTVKTRVTVNFSPEEEHIISCLKLKFKLACRIWSEDAVFNGNDDLLFSLSTKTITKDGTYDFVGSVHHELLDEDWEGNDEVYAKFGLAAVAFPMTAVARTPTQVGNY